MEIYHLGELIHRQSEKYGKRTALKYQNEIHGKWLNLSWREFSDKTMQCAYAIAEMGIKPHDNIGIYAQNMEKYLIADFAAYANRAVMVPMYATSSPLQVAYIVNDARIEMIFVGEQFQYNNAYKVQRESNVLKKLIVFDRNVVLNPEDKTSEYFDDFITTGDNSHSQALVNVRVKQLRKSDLASIIYTSGTTGLPKGVMLTHDNFIEALRTNATRLTQLSDKDVSMSFLPFTHIFEKAWSYLCLEIGITIAVNRDPRFIQETIKQIRPTLMSNVPRFWEKVYQGVQEKINSSNKVLRWFFNDAIKTGKKFNLQYKNNGKKAPVFTTLKFRIYQATIYFLLKYVIGIQRGNFFPVAGAPLSDTINEFLQSVDIHIIYGYGLTETSASVSCFPKTGFKIGTVGLVMPGVEVKIGKDNEILVRGRTVMKGYYNKPEATAEAFTDEGFFRTGDAGYLTDKNEIVLTERIKDLYKTSNGKYIAPQMIEARLCEDRYIEQVAVIGNERKFVSAFIIPDYEALRKYAQANNIEVETTEELVAHPDIEAFLFGRIEMLQTDFTSFEKVKKFILLPRPFTIESGELTNTLKLRRKVILEKYAEEIERMYRN